MNAFGPVRRRLFVMCAATISAALLHQQSASALNILWWSDNGPAGFSGPVANAFDDAFTTNILQNAGHNVVRFNSPDAGATPLTQAEIDAINTNDLIIIGRSIASGAVQNPPQVNQWNTNIFKPMLLQSAYMVRASRLGWFTGEVVTPDGVTGPVGAVDLSDPETAYIFQDVAMTGNLTTDPFDEPIDRNTSLMFSAPVAGGTVLATQAVGAASGILIAEFPQGTAVKGGADILAGYRMFFASGSREVSGIPNAGKDNLTPTGEALFLRAVEIAAAEGQVPSGPATPIVITNQPQSITVLERGAATFSLMATGTPQSFRWYRSDDGGTLFTLIPGARQSSYTLNSAAFPGDNGAQFFATISNALGVVTSSVVTLTVIADTAAPTIVSAIGDLDPTRVRLVFSEPLDPNTVNQSNFEIFLTGTTPSGLYATFGTTLTNNGTVVELITDPRVARENYSIQILDVRDSSSGNNLISPNPLVVPIRPTIQLIGFHTENEWKYDINNGDRTGTGWEAVGFDDSAWPSGPAGLGLDAVENAVPIRTQIPYMANGVVSYFRRHFNLPGATNGVILTLRDVLEDGAVYYLNGQEVFRNRMPTGPVTFATLATGAPDPTPITGPFNIPATNLVSGDNVIAVEVHQSAANSTDVELAVELLATISSFSAPAPRLDFVRNANGTVTLSWNAPGFCLQEASVLSGPSTVWSPSTVVSGTPFTPTGTAKFYRLSNGCN